jgi:catalase (peroxidase I)
VYKKAFPKFKEIRNKLMNKKQWFKEGFKRIWKILLKPSLFTYTFYLKPFVPLMQLTLK